MSSHVAIHASAIALEGRALLIMGASGSGKSSLAARLIRNAPPDFSSCLIGDDRILLRFDAAGTAVARPHPRTAGFIERRGFGLVWIGFMPRAPVAAVVLLGEVAAPASLGGLPTFLLGKREAPVEEHAERVIAWWQTRNAARAQQSKGKRGYLSLPTGKDHHCSDIIV